MLQRGRNWGQDPSSLHLHPGVNPVEKACILGVLTHLRSQAHRVTKRNNLQSETAKPTNTRENQMVRGKYKNLTNRNQDYLAATEPSTPPQQVLDTSTHEESKIWI